MYSQIERYTTEYERDAEGNKIPDRLSGYKLTEQTIQARRKYRQAVMKGREPMDNLPGNLRADPRKPDLELPKLRYGLAFTTEQLLDCAEYYELPLEDLPIERHALHVCDALCQINSLLSGACKMILRITTLVDADNEWMVPLYDNYNWWSERLVPEEEEEVVTLIRRALKITMPLLHHEPRSQAVLVRVTLVMIDCLASLPSCSSLKRSLLPTSVVVILVRAVVMCMMNSLVFDHGESRLGRMHQISTTFARRLAKVLAASQVFFNCLWMSGTRAYAANTTRQRL